MSLMMSGDKGISAFPEGDKLLTWVATVTGPDESVYEGNHKYKVQSGDHMATPRPTGMNFFLFMDCRPQVQTPSGVSLRVSIHSSHSSLYKSLFPSERGCPWQHLLRHTQRKVECTLRSQNHIAVHPVIVR